MTDTAPDYEDDDQILALVQTLRQDVMAVLAPRLADQVELAARALTTYRFKERRRAALMRVLNGK